MGMWAKEMGVLGIIGGIGPESTIEYYRTVIASYRARKSDGSYPELIINSVDLKRRSEQTFVTNASTLFCSEPSRFTAWRLFVLLKGSSRWRGVFAGTRGACDPPVTNRKSKIESLGKSDTKEA
jgi:hypothetical protein